MKYLEEFFAFARERELIRIKRDAGLPHPWTKDPIMQQFFFCNVFREDDKTTRWFKRYIRDKVKDDAPRAILACTAFRWFNYMPSGALLADSLIAGRLDRDVLKPQLRQLGQVISGAYLIKTPAGMNKVDGIFKCLKPVEAALGELCCAERTLENMHREMMQFPYLGRFMAYEIVTDLRHTCVLDAAPDIMTWASAGPGCARGLGYVCDDNPDMFSYSSNWGQDEMLQLMAQILAASREKINWPGPRPWEMREVEHVLCEYAKYRRAQKGIKVKRRFRYADH